MPFKFNSEFSKSREEMQSLKKNWADKPTKSSIPQKSETGPKPLRTITPKTSASPTPSFSSKDIAPEKKVDDKNKDKAIKKDTQAVPATPPAGDRK